MPEHSSEYVSKTTCFGDIFINVYERNRIKSMEENQITWELREHISENRFGAQAPGALFSIFCEIYILKLFKK
jgi:hypothetical protein